MRKIVGIAMLAVLVAVPAVAQKVHVDYDRSVNFDSYKTFAWGGNSEASLADESPLMHSRIKNAIEYHLSTVGLTENTDNPDLVVTYYTDSKEEVRFTTTGMGYGYGPGWGWDPYWGGGMSTSTTTAHKYERGALVIDLWDPAKKHAVWRGTASAAIKSNPQKEAKQIDKAVAKMINTFEKMYTKGR